MFKKTAGIKYGARWGGLGGNKTNITNILYTYEFNTYRTTRYKQAFSISESGSNIRHGHVKTPCYKNRHNGVIMGASHLNVRNINYMHMGTFPLSGI